MTYTDEALIDLFKNDQEEFLKVCSDISDASGELPQFGKYIYIKQSLATNRPLPKGATALLNELEEIYGGIDTSILQPYNGPIDIAYFESTLSTLLNKLADQLKQKDQLVYEGMIEFVEALTENVRFSKGKRDRNGYKYQIDKVNELISWLDNFKTKVYKLEGDISIWLTPSRFFHILIGWGGPV